jgi:hypothetical protein
MLDTFLTVIRSVEERSTEPDRCGAEAETFQHVGAAADAGVDEDFEMQED